MKTLCQRDPESGLCTQCGKQRKAGDRVNCPANSTVERQARRAAKPQPQLGDLTEMFFESLGITKEAYLKVKGELGLDPKKCGCDYRRELINGVGRVLGFDAAFGMFRKWRSDAVRRTVDEQRTNTGESPA